MNLGKPDNNDKAKYNTYQIRNSLTNNELILISVELKI